MKDRSTDSTSLKDSPKAQTGSGFDDLLFNNSNFKDTIMVDPLDVIEVSGEQLRPVLEEKPTINRDQIEYSRLLKEPLLKLAQEYQGVKITKNNQELVVGRFQDQFTTWINNGSVRWPFLNEKEWRITFTAVDTKFRVSFTSNVKAFFEGKINGQGKSWD